MSMRNVDHGGIIKKPVVNNDYLVTMANSEVNMNINGSDTVVDHGGVEVAQTQNYNNIEVAASPNISGVQIGYVQPITVSGLVIDHGGPIQPRTIVNDEQ
jgi:hypothetical protein